MRTLRLMALAVVMAGSPVLLLAAPDDPVASDFGIDSVPGGKVVVKWQAAAGASQLYWAPSLDNTVAWQLLHGAIPIPGNYWQAEFLTSPARAFFRVQPAATPVPPSNVRLIMTGDHFRLEWDSTSDAAGYTVYIGLTQGTGPGSYLQRLTLPLANVLEITGLTAGQTYYLAIAATNAAGEGAPAAVLSGVFGPKVNFTGRAVQSFLLPSGAAFEVLAEGTVLQLVRVGGGDGAGYQTTVNANGEFSLQDLPAGSYLISYFVNGRFVPLPAPARNWNGLPLTGPLVLPSGPSPPPPGMTLLGYLRLSTGDPARISMPQFGLNAQAQITVMFADGSSRIVVPDALGAWAVPEITGSFPVTITASYQGLTTVTTIPAPPAALAMTMVQFPQQLPSLQRITVQQEGQEALRISPGLPVTFKAEIYNPDGLPVTPRWIVEYNGATQISLTAATTFTLNLTGATGGGMARVQCIPSNYVVEYTGSFDIPVVPPGNSGNACWSGRTGLWNPNFPNDVDPVHPATVTVKHAAAGSPTVATTTLNQNGVPWFDTNVDPTAAGPYLVRVDKPDHMRFLWPFDFQLPLESTFSVVPASISYHSQVTGTLTVSGPRGMSLSLPYGSLYEADNTPWYGDIIVSMAAWDPLVRSPLPPGAESRGPGPRWSLFAQSGVWFDITTDGGAPLRPIIAVPAAAGGRRDVGGQPPVPTLTLPTGSDFPNSSIPCFHQVETTGYFEQWGAAPEYKATKTGPGRYTVQLGGKGLFILAWPAALIEPVFTADRSLNHPFEMLVNKSIFPVTVTSVGKTNFGHLYLPQTYGADIEILDLLQAPGLHYPNPANASLTRPLDPMRKKVIVRTFNALGPPNGVVAPLPAITPVVVPLTLATSEPALKKPGETTVGTIKDPKKFLSRTNSSPQDAQAYYAKIGAPPDLATWRGKRGFPVAFGAPLAGAGLDTYATCYYYNLGDLGFARAQTMRITTSPASPNGDGQKNVAFAVTNYPTLEDARCQRGPIATVCMDFSALRDRGENEFKRYTRFYVYAGRDGKLLDCADLDGSGEAKCVPNLCVICHGGTKYKAGGTTNLGSRFLPFDVASYSFHPKFGVQKQEMAAMNAGVLEALPGTDGPAIKDLIAGWYNNSNPLAGPATYNTFNQDYVPSTVAGFNWRAIPANQALYSNVFKHSCRVCHISRDAGKVQIGSFNELLGESSSYTSSCTGLGMPHSQRTWGIFWGSRGSKNLGNLSVPDMPTQLREALGETACPVLRAE